MTTLQEKQIQREAFQKGLQGKMRPWVAVPELIPDVGFSALELSRATHLSVPRVLDFSHGVVNIGGQVFRFVKEKSAPNSIPRIKHSIHGAVRSPNIKGVRQDPGRTLDEDRLRELNSRETKDRTRISLEPVDDTRLRTTRRDAIKARVSKRWEERTVKPKDANTDQISEKVRAELKVRRDLILDTLFWGKLPRPWHNICIPFEDIELTEKEMVQLGEISRLGERFIGGSKQLIDELCRNHDPLSVSLRKLLGIRNPKSISHAIQTTKISFMRMDLVQDQDGQFHPVEFEPGKTHGFGFVSGTDDLAPRPFGVGIAETLAEKTRNRPQTIFLTEGEQFYTDEMLFLCKKVEELGGHLSIESETDGLHPRGDMFVGQEFLKDPSAADLEKVISNKALMGIIHNLHGDQELEGILRQSFGVSLDGLRGVIPRTFVLSLCSKSVRDELVRDICQGQNFFVKQLDTSGAKGIIPPDQKNRQIEMLRQNRTDGVAQEAIKSKPFDLAITGIREFAPRSVKDFAGRFSIFQVEGDEGPVIMRVGFTASEGAVAHGGEDSVFASCSVPRRI